MRCTLPLVLVSVMSACGGDDDGSSESTTIPTTSNATVPTTSSDTSSGQTTGVDTTTDDTETTAPVDTSTGETTTGDATTGGADDPNYPPTDAGACPPNFAPIVLPGGSVCAPFCAGADAPCPDPAAGDALPVCTPFETEGGSGGPCTTHDDCPDDEACGTRSTCVAVAFWGCRLECPDAQTCSDGMTCSAGACAYP